jgi:hypothetical protein
LTSRAPGIGLAADFNGGADGGKLFDVWRLGAQSLAESVTVAMLSNDAWHLMNRRVDPLPEDFRGDDWDVYVDRAACRTQQRAAMMVSPGLGASVTRCAQILICSIEA